jgi:hypothetical protein
MPAVAGLTPGRPAASCAAATAAGLGDGSFYIGSAADNSVRTLCRRGDALPEWPHFEVVGGPPVAYYPFENSLKDHISGYDMESRAGKLEQYGDGRVGKAFSFVGNTFLEADFDSYVFHGPSTVVSLHGSHCHDHYLPPTMSYLVFLETNLSPQYIVPVGQIADNQRWRRAPRRPRQHGGYSPRIVALHDSQVLPAIRLLR